MERRCALLPQAHLAPAALHEAMRYGRAGGRQARAALLAFPAGELADASAERIGSQRPRSS